MTWSSSSRRQLPIHRSVIPFCQGACTLVRFGVRPVDFSNSTHRHEICNRGPRITYDMAQIQEKLPAVVTVRRWLVGGWSVRLLFPVVREIRGHFIALKATVHYRRKDLLVRSHSGGGGGLPQTELTLYRLYKGCLYRVLRAIEESWGLARIGRTAVIFPEEYTGEEKYLVFAKSRWMCSDPDKAATCRTRALSCTVHKWDPKQFTFGIDSATLNRFCNSRTHMPHAAVS